MSLNSIENFLEMMLAERGASDNTRESYGRDLYDYMDYLCEFFPTIKMEDATDNEIEGYIAHLFKKQFAHATIARRFSSLKQYFFFLISEGERENDPTTHITVKTKPTSLPKYLTVDEIDTLMKTAQEDTSFEGLRLNALLEILYASGLRVSELVKLKKSSIQETYSNEIQQNMLYLIVSGKGNKERLVPINANAKHAVNTYLSALPEADQTSTFLFPSNGKEGYLTRQRFGQLLKQLAINANISPSRVSPHVIRHSFATHLLNNGMDLRTLQELLGHEDISTTQIYTHIADDSLQELVNEKHPLAHKKVSEI